MTKVFPFCHRMASFYCHTYRFIDFWFPSPSDKNYLFFVPCQWIWAVSIVHVLLMMLQITAIIIAIVLWFCFLISGIKRHRFFKIIGDHISWKYCFFSLSTCFRYSNHRIALLDFFLCVCVVLCFNWLNHCTSLVNARANTGGTTLCLVLITERKAKRIFTLCWNTLLAGVLSHFLLYRNL